MKNSKANKSNNITIEEFVKKFTACENGRFCQVENCPFLHNIKTRMCKFGQNCKNIALCNFAHKESEIYIFECKFGDKCKNEKCKYSHPNNNFWNVSQIKKDVNNIENLSKNNFPKTIKTGSIPKPQIKYSEMKPVFDFVNCAVLKGNVDEIVDKYSCIKKYNKLIITIE